jgi:hypothetical protein
MAVSRHLVWLLALAVACAHAPAAPGGTPPPAAPPIATPTPTATPPTPSGTPIPAPASAADLPEIVLAAVGDVMLGSAFPDESGLPPGDGTSLLTEVAPVLSRADVAFGNLEGPLADEGTSEKCARSRPGRCYAFRSPTRYARHLAAAGFGVLGLANNHAGDFGAEGRASTRRALDAAGLAHAGEPGDVARLRVKGRRLAVVAFATSDATLDLRDLEEARRVVAALAAENDLVVVSFHGGAEGAAHQHVPPGPEEFLGEDRGDLRAFAHAVVDAGASLVVGHGPHVVRGMEVYRGRLVAYSLGNFATYGSFNLSGPNGLSLVLEVRLGPDGAFRGGRVHPVRQEKPGGPRLDPQGLVIPLLRSLSEADFGQSAVVVEGDGTLQPPGHSSKPSAESDRSGLPSSAAAMRAASKRPKAANSSPAR